MTKRYEARWDYDAQDGDQGELFARWAADGLKSGASLEIKNDMASWRTGNVFIEFECFVSGQWMPSGIHELKTQAHIWAHITVGPMVIFAPTEYVRWVALTHGEFREMGKTKSSHPTRGYILPVPKFTSALVDIARGQTAAAAAAVPDLCATDPEAPYGRDHKGIPVAPWGYTKARKVKLNPGGRQADKPIPAALWGEPGASRSDGYEPTWPKDGAA